MITCTVSPLLVYVIIIGGRTPQPAFLVNACALIVQHIFVYEWELAGGTIGIATRCECLTRSAWSIAHCVWNWGISNKFRKSHKTWFSDITYICGIVTWANTPAFFNIIVCCCWAPWSFVVYTGTFVIHGAFVSEWELAESSIGIAGYSVCETGCAGYCRRSSGTCFIAWSSWK